MTEFDPLSHAHTLFRALESGAVGDEIRQYYHPDAVQVEHPSAVLPTGGVRGIDAMIDASRRGRGMMASQRYDVTSSHRAGDVLLLQLTWSAELAVPLAGLPAGATIRAHVAMLLTFTDALIVRHETYDCYEPFAA